MPGHWAIRGQATCSIESRNFPQQDHGPNATTIHERRATDWTIIGYTFTNKNLVIVLRVKRLEDLGDAVLDKVALGLFVTAKGELSTVCWTKRGKEKDFTDHGLQLDENKHTGAEKRVQ